MNGESKFPFLANEERQNEREQAILPINGMPGQHDEYQNYANYDADMMRALTIQDCAIIAARLSQYCVYIQRCFNRNKRRIKFLEAEVRKTIASKVQGYGGQWEFQKQQAINDDEYALQNHKKMLEYEQVNTTIEHLSLSIKDLADRYKDLQFAKIQERKSDVG